MYRNADLRDLDWGVDVIGARVKSVQCHFRYARICIGICLGRLINRKTKPNVDEASDNVHDPCKAF